MKHVITNHTPLAQFLSKINSFEDFKAFKERKNLFLWEHMAKEIMVHHQLPAASLSLFTEGTNIVFSYGQEKVIKIFPPFHADQFDRDVLIMQHFMPCLDGKLSVKTPVILHQGNYQGWFYIVMNKLDGVLLEGLWDTLDQKNKIVIIHELGTLIRKVHELPTKGLESIDCHWEKFIDHQINACVEHHKTAGLPDFLLKEIPDYIGAVADDLRYIEKPVLLTGEYTPMNLLVKQIDGVWHIDGLIDFGDAMLGLREYDLLGPGAFLIQGEKDLLKTFLNAYGYSPDTLTERFSHKLTGLSLLHQYSNLSGLRIKNWQEKVKNLKDVEKLIWGIF